MQQSSPLRRPFEYKQYHVTFILIAVNVLVYFLTSVSPRTELTLSLISPAVQSPYYSTAFWQVFTYMFVHANITHILFNMLGLFFFGIQVERRLGSTEFLWYYLVSGVGAGLISLGLFWLAGTPTVLLGASGAVFAVMLAFATLFPGAMIYVFGIIPVRAPVLVLVYTGIEIVSEFFGFRSGVAHLTHLAGFLVGYLYLLGRLGLNPIRIFLGNRR